MTTADVRLHQLRTESIGCILLIVQAASCSFPFITLVAAPSMDTLGAGSPGNPPGILLVDIWQALVLQPFLAAVLDMEHPHCPILAASEGFSQATTFPTPTFYLADAKPLFFPAGELFSESVEIEPVVLTNRAIFPPKIYSPPLGFRWPTDIGLDAFVKSLELLRRVYKAFLSSLSLKLGSPASTRIPWSLPFQLAATL
jgi:hypothetical protein